MRKQSFILLLLLAGSIIINDACKKDPLNNDLNKIKLQLQQTLDDKLFNQLDFDSVSFNKASVPEIVTIGFKNKPASEQFIILLVNTDYGIRSGRFINVHTTIESGTVEGSISIKSLNGDIILENAAIHNGYIQWKKPPFGLRDMVLPGAGGSALPEVILVSSYSNFLVQLTMYYSLLGMTGTGSPNTYYAPSSSSTGVYYGNENLHHATNGGGPSTLKSTMINIDFETAQTKAAIDLEKYIKCFASVPDAGATCSIELFTDIPVDSDPNKLLDWKTRSPGHTFIQLKKTSGSQSVIQNIGFYPVTDYKSILTPAPVAGKFVDNSNHEFNAAIKMSMSSDNFRSVLNQILYLSKFVKYDIDEYNCTDFALEIFNYRRATALQIVKLDIPGGQAPAGSSTPQGLYLKLQSMKKNNDPDAPNITTNIVKGFVAVGKGACN